MVRNPTDLAQCKHSINLVEINQKGRENERNVIANRFVSLVDNSPRN